MSNNFNEAKKTIDAFAAMGLTDFNIHCNPHTLMKDLPHLDGSKGKLRLHKVETMTGDQILKDFDRFTMKNRQGYNIQFTPLKMETDKPTSERPYHPYIFLDDVTPLMMQNMKNDGMHMNIIIASSPGNYHGWVKVADNILTYKQLTTAQNALVQRYGTDRGGKTPSHFGKLPGTFNNKPDYKDVFIRLAYSNAEYKNNSRVIGGFAQKFATNQAIDDNKRAAEQKERLARLGDRNIERGHISDYVARKMSQFPLAENNDLDFSLIMSCLGAGYHADEVIAELTIQYEAIATPERKKKKGNIRDYITRSVRKAEGYASKR